MGRPRHRLHLGRWVLANGMMAYGVFQGWGNDPLSFVPEPIKGVVRKVEGKRVTVALGVTTDANGGQEVDATVRLPAAIGDVVEVGPPDGPASARERGKLAETAGNAVIIELDAAGGLAAADAAGVKAIGNNAEILGEISR